MGKKIGHINKTTEKWRLLKLGNVDVYTFLSLYEALEIAKNRGTIGNTLALARPLVSVLVGKNKSISEVNVPFCKENNIPISRNIVSGGPFLNGGWCGCIIVSDIDFFPGKSVILDYLMECMVKACQILGMPANRRPKSNDVLVRGRKISGAGLNFFKDTLSFGATLGLDFDADLAEKTLRVSPEKFMDKEAKTVAEWVTYARRELGREVSLEEVEAALIQGFGDVLGVQFEEAKLTTGELATIDELQVRYRSEEWIKYGRWSPVKDY